MPVKTLAMKRLEGHKRNFYLGDHLGRIPDYGDFYPADLVEKVITDLSNQVLEERKKWTSMFDSFRDKRKSLRKERHDAHAALHRLQMEFAEMSYAYYFLAAENCANPEDIDVVLKRLRFWTRVRNQLAYEKMLHDHNATKKKSEHYEQNRIV